MQFEKHLSKQEKKSLRDIFLSFSDVVAFTDKELGETGLIIHSINTGNGKPVNTMTWKLPYTLRQEIEVEMKSWFIEPSNSQ